MAGLGTDWLWVSEGQGGVGDGSRFLEGGEWVEPQTEIENTEEEEEVWGQICARSWPAGV